MMNRQTIARPSPAVFWMLVAMGFAGLAPCVLLPEWREYQSLQLAEQWERHRLVTLKDTVERQDRDLQVLQSDPAAVARLARRDLRFHRPGETVVHVPVTLMAARPDDTFVATPIPPPQWLARWQAHLPAFDYDAVFCHEKSRTIVMAMSLGVIALAMILYRRSIA